MGPQLVLLAVEAQRALQQPPRRFIQQVSKKGATNALSTQFVREDDAVVQARRLDGGRPLALELREPAERGKQLRFMQYRGFSGFRAD